ncbi:MAG TPA: acyl transferase, partial [Saprospiraceae bacterium]|nr:acyl transferase [Saprospiraceae bacterium]
MNSFSSSPTDFDKKALTLFRKQATENDFYRRFLEILKVQPQNIDQVSNIPFLPVQLFKHNEIKTGDWLEQNVFLSSGTTLHTRSRHF